MTPQTAIAVCESYAIDGKMPYEGSVGLRIKGLQQFREAIKECSSLARECLERRQKDAIFLNEKTVDIGKVLDELETELTLDRVWYVPGVITGFEKIRAKYCSVSKEEKPTRKRGYFVLKDGELEIEWEDILE